MSWRVFSTLFLPLLLILNGSAAEPAPSVDRTFVLGEVKKPGAVTLTENGMTVYDVVAYCGGLSRLANGKAVRLIHHLSDHKQIVIVVNLDYVSNTPNAPDPVVKPGDVIVVPEVTTQSQ